MSFKTIRLFINILISLGLAGCIQIIPVNVIQRIVISDNGEVMTIYEGNFRDLSEIGKIMTQSEKWIVAPPDNHEEMVNIVNKIASKFSKLITFTAKGDYYFIRWQDQNNLPMIARDTIIKNNNDPEVVVPVNLEYSSNTKTFIVVDYLNQLDKTIKKDTQNNQDEYVQKILKLKDKYFNELKAKIEIEINPKWVVTAGGYENFDKLPDGGEGRKVFTYNLSGAPNNRKVIDFSFALELEDKNSVEYKLKHAKSGDSCKSLPGENCKCGPFMLIDPDTGKKAAKRPYTLIAGEKTRKGCTDENGLVEAEQITNATGKCMVILAKEEYSELCK